jgi:hypothetical protein
MRNGVAFLTAAKRDKASARRTSGSIGFRCAQTDVPTAVDEENESTLPDTYRLWQNAPNPFNPETTLRFDLAQSAEVRLEIFDALGQKVKTLVAQSLPAGAHQVRWRGVDAYGRQVSSGVYFYRLQADGYTRMNRMLLLK